MRLKKLRIAVAGSVSSNASETYRNLASALQWLNGQIFLGAGSSDADTVASSKATATTVAAAAAQTQSTNYLASNATAAAAGRRLLWQPYDGVGIAPGGGGRRLLVDLTNYQAAVTNVTSKYQVRCL